MSRVTGLTLTQLTTLAETTDQNFSEFPNDIPGIPRQDHRFLPTAVIQLTAQAHREKTINLLQLDRLQNATSDYPIHKLVGVAVVTGYSLQQLEVIAIKTGISYFETAESIKNTPEDLRTGKHRDHTSQIRALKLIVLDAGQRAEVSQKHFLEEGGTVTVAAPPFGDQKAKVDAPTSDQQRTITVPPFGQEPTPQTWHIPDEHGLMTLYLTPLQKEPLFHHHTKHLEKQ